MMADGGMQPLEIMPDAGNARLFRDALGRFATGVTLISIMGPDGPMGFTASSFASLSLDPPLVLWSPARASHRYPHFAAAEHYSIHVLGQDQADWPTRFARGGPGFEGLSWRASREGVPVLAGTLARFDCRRHATHDGGDHLIIVGQVLRLTLEEGAPLVFANSRFGGFAG
ncbi:MAG: flavin oxidoreductase [Rhodobacter sp.]|nr:flavin oxidoreductase [Rhodobacter sp.]